MAATIPGVDEALGRPPLRFRGEHDVWLESDSMASEIRRAVPLQAVAASKPDGAARWATEATSVRSQAFGTVGGCFTARVGSVVPRRTPGTVSRAPFVTARAMQPWISIDQVESEAPMANRFDSGRFVVVRRTSSPRDGQRIRANLATDTRAIGVENSHMVLARLIGGVAACHRLMANLFDPRTNEYVNDRIRCRHLTVDSVRGMPRWSPPGVGC